MKLQKWLITLLIALPIVLIILNHARQFQKMPIRMEKSRTVLLPPIDILFRYFDFNEKNALRQWGEKTFRGRVVYELEFDKRGGFIHSQSKKTASAIFYRIKFDIRDYPYLEWKWRVGKFPDKRLAETPKKQDDFAARMYVIFTSRFFTHFRCVEYVWDQFAPEGTVLKSPYSDQIMQLVVESGAARPGEWVTERQNVIADYERLFKEKPKMKVSAIAVMTDSEGTETEAEGFFDDIQIGKSKESTP